MLTEKSKEKQKNLYDDVLSMGKGEFFVEKNFCSISIIEDEKNYTIALINKCFFLQRKKKQKKNSKLK